MPQGYMPQGYMPQGYMPQGYMPQGYMPQGDMPQGDMPQAMYVELCLQECAVVKQTHKLTYSLAANHVCMFYYLNMI